MKGQIITSNISDRELTIYLPPSYQEAGTGFPVVYLQDQGELFHPAASNSLETLEALFAAGKLMELILVGVETKTRQRDYTPWHAPALEQRYGDFEGRGADYLAFLVDEVKAYIDRTFQTLPQPERTGIGGVSLGGLIALYAAYIYPGVFGRIASISGSLWYDGFVEYMEAQPLTCTGRKVYLDVGSLEGAAKTNRQKTMVPQTKAAYQILRNKGLTADHCQLVIDEGAIHHWRFFTKRFPSAMQWLFPAA